MPWRTGWVWRPDVAQVPGLPELATAAPATGNRDEGEAT
jgi:hypothetical protein